jgi:glycosyltransferase involved in cell wall biosynthesis
VHICFITEEYPPETGWGGIATYTYEVAMYLSYNNISVSVIALSDNEQYKEQKINSFLTVYRLSTKVYELIKLPYLWRYSKYLNGFAYHAYLKAKEIHQHQPIALIEAAEFRANSLYTYFFLNAIPKVLRLHTSSRIVALLNKRGFGSKIVNWQENMVLKLAGNINAPSKAIIPLTFAKAGITKVPPVQFMPNPINYQAFEPLLALEKKPFSLIYVGRLEKRKGIDLIIEALPNLLALHPNIQITFLGKDGQMNAGLSYAQHIKNQLNKEQISRVHFKQVPRTEVPKIIAEHELAIFPSIWENCPYVLLESMAVGTPALVSPQGGMAEIVEDGINGWHLNPLSADTLVNQVGLIFNHSDKEKRLKNIAQAATLRIAQHYDVKVLGPQFIKYYRSVIANA